MLRSPNPTTSQQLPSLLALAAQLLRNGRTAEAIAPLREAALLQPSNASIQHDLGLACLEVNRLPEAVAALELAIGGDPHYADAHFRLGIALEKLGNTSGAIAAYNHATKLLPSLTEAWFRAGALFYMLGDRNEAIFCFRRAAETGGTTSFGQLGKVRALLTEERYKEAEEAQRETLALDPANGMAHDLLGNLLTEFGRFDEARSCFERAIALAPLLAGSYYDLVRCRPITRDDGLLETMEAALATPGLEAPQRLRLHLALGKAADDIGDYALAMQHLDAGDAVRRSFTMFNSTAFDVEIDRMIARCTPEMMARASQVGSELGSELGNRDATPILILGMPRSGTTLVEQIVSNHPQVAGAGELQFWNGRGAEWHRAEWHSTGAAGTEATYLKKTAAAYLDLLRTIAPAAARVTDKMPFNFLWAGLIHLALPHATIIHCRRNLLDTALSIHQTHFHPSLPFPTGGVELVKYFRSYRRLMDHWRKVLPADRFIEVDYEQLTRAPEAEIRRIIAACGLAWDERCMHPESNQRAVRTPSKWQARQPIYRNSVGRWRRYEPWLGALRALADDGPEEMADLA